LASRFYTSAGIAVAQARSLFKTGWEDVHIVDADGGLFYPDKFDQLLGTSNNDVFAA
jgi:hypothetical protein